MKSTRSSIALFALAAVAALALSGCKKPESDPSQAHSTAADTSTATSTASVPAAQTQGATPAAPTPTTPEAKSYSADGTIDKVDTAAGTVTISHGAVAALGWQPMTMEFHLKDKTTATSFKAGDKVHFDFQENSGQYLITRMQSGK